MFLNKRVLESCGLSGAAVYIYTWCTDETCYLDTSEMHKLEHSDSDRHCDGDSESQPL